jgi:hypothetical protein
MFLRGNVRNKDGRDHTYWSLVETVRTGWSASENSLLSGRAEQFGAGTLADHC